MYILLATLFFPPTHNAGTENYTFTLARSLIQNGHRVEVVCADKWGLGDSYWNGVMRDEYQGIPVHRIRINWTRAENPNRVLYINSSVERWLEKHLRETRPDLVHVTSAITLGVGILRAPSILGIPLVLTLTDFWFVCPTIQLLRSDGNLCNGEKSAWDCQQCMGANSQLFLGIDSILPDAIRPAFWDKMSRVTPLTKMRGLRGNLLDMSERKQLLKEALSFPDRIFAPSKFVQQKVSQLTSTSVNVLNHGHDLSWVENLGPKTVSDKLRIAYIGQLQPIKGVHVLIDAFQMAEIDTQATLSIFGDLSTRPDYVSKLEKLANDNPSINFRGRFEHEDISDVFSNIDVVVVPSLWYENAPLVIQEAFAAKTPVVATNLGGMAEFIDHELSGLLFSRGDAADLARTLRRLVMNPDLIRHLSEGIPPVKTNDEELMEIENIYRDLLVNSTFISA